VKASNSIGSRKLASAPMPDTQAPRRQVMSILPDHLRPITVESSRHLDGRTGARRLGNASRIAGDCWPRSSDAQASTKVTRVVGTPTLNRQSVLRLNHRPERPSCCSIKMAIVASRPALTPAVARSCGPGCPQGIAAGGAQRPGRRRADCILIAETGDEARLR
jgi:hypothetical protein